MSAVARDRAGDFCARFGLAAPVILAPMAGACPPTLSAAVAAGGGMAALGGLFLSPASIGEWTADFRRLGGGPLQINLWTPQPAPPRHERQEARIREFLGRWGPPPTPTQTAPAAPVFTEQFAAALAARPSAVSSIMGLPAPDLIREARELGVSWWATVTTVGEARAAEAAGADVIVAQGAEAGGHRGAFEPEAAERQLVGLFALVPRIADVVKAPVVASGGIADARGVAAALTLGASAVQIGTAFLRCPEAGLPSAWADALAGLEPEEAELTRAFSGRAGRAIGTEFVRAARSPGAPAPAPYPTQRALTAAMRSDAVRQNRLAGMQAWAGQAAATAQPQPARAFTEALWRSALDLLPERQGAARALGDPGRT